jgi:hypothetical protein
MAKKPKKPKKGDHVFLIGARKFLRMYYRDDVIKDGKEHAYCTWVIPNMQDHNLDKCGFDWYPVKLLTTEPTSTPGEIYGINLNSGL